MSDEGYGDESEACDIRFFIVTVRKRYSSTGFNKFSPFRVSYHFHIV